MKSGTTKNKKKKLSPMSFEETARALGCDPDTATFERAFAKIAPARKAGDTVPQRKPRKPKP